MKRALILMSAILTVSLLLATQVASQQIVPAGPAGYIYIPASSIQHPEDIGVRAHTNIQLFIPYNKPDNLVPPPNAETPASLACVYKLVTSQPGGCPINGATQNPTGGWGAIAIVDAYDNPNAEQDLTTFSTQFHLPPCTKANGCFHQVYASGQQPENDPGGWSLEEALDIEMAHAMAPNAKIILVEAATNYDTDLYPAEDLAAQLVVQAGGGLVTNSWSGAEYADETSDDAHFKTNGVVYLASTGDYGAPVGYPAASRFVIAAGGTSVNRAGGQLTGESGWSGSGGGPSTFESRPAWQNVIQKIVGSKRGTPDLSFDADPATGVAMYDLDGMYMWLQIGGTSVSSPALAGILNAAGHKAKSSTGELTGLYTVASKYYKELWRDETVGNNGYACQKGWDFVTGIGSPITYHGK